MSSPRPQLLVAEPPPGYRLRPPLVVDCSVMAAALFEEEASEEAVEMMRGKLLFAPDLLAHEMVNVAVRKLRSGWPAENVQQAIIDFSAHDVELQATDRVTQFELAHRYKVSGYDAAYLWLAAELKAPLATFDKKLAAAAQAPLSSLP